jgi:hypothetical protein
MSLKKLTGSEDANMYTLWEYDCKYRIKLSLWRCQYVYTVRVWL